MSLDFAEPITPASTEPVILEGKPLDFATLTRIARKSTHVAANGEAMDRVRGARMVGNAGDFVRSPHMAGARRNPEPAHLSRRSG